LCLLAGCGEAAVEKQQGSDDPTAVLVGEIDAERWCNMVGIIEIALVAHLVDCPPEFGDDCRPPMLPGPIEGTRVTCPSTEGTVLAEVELPLPGRYRVEAVGRHTAGEEDTECYGPTSEAQDIVVTVDDIEAQVERFVVSTGAPCR
jgi:hypothetical protein